MKVVLVRTLAVLAVGAILPLVGCGGGRAADRVDVTGTVTYQGQPIQEGSITFDPIGEGPVAGALITNGTYEATGRGAVPVGEYIVRISATVEETENWDQDDPAFPVPPRRELLPPRYHRESELVREIPSDARSIELNFDLE